jgi:hypothetical protein
MTNRRDLYPPIESYRMGALRLDARHAMYWDQSGNPPAAPDRIRRNKGSPGVDGMTIDDAKDYLREHWPSIRSQLLASVPRGPNTCNARKERLS